MNMIKITKLLKGGMTMNVNDMAVKILNVKNKYKLDITEEDILKAVNDYYNTKLTVIDERNIEEVNVMDYPFEYILEKLLNGHVVDKILYTERNLYKCNMIKQLTDEIKNMRTDYNQNTFTQRQIRSN